MKEKIGFVGLGIMGKPMASNLLDAEYSVNAYDLISKNLYPKNKEDLKIEENDQDSALGSIGLKPKIVH